MELAKCIYPFIKTSPEKTRPARLFATKVQELLKIGENWKPVVGLEVHAQISAKSKLFSGAGTSFGSPINSAVSFFDAAIPGTLPVLNKRCVEAGITTALALSCKINEVSHFDRKHYFYADLPAGYQITQQRKPLAVDGILHFNVFTPGIHKQPYPKHSKIKQLQLEQDSGRSLHDEETKRSLIDLNRAGLPLMELVFEPDLEDGEEAAALVKELCAILLRLGTCSCKMEEGAFRVDANVSVNRPGEPLGVRTEIKNIGSVRAVAAAVNFEIERQVLMLEDGLEVVNETRSWNTDTNKTVSMRDKEVKQDYRFMPEPNLPPLRVHLDSNLENKYNLIDVPFLKEQLPELPEESRRNLVEKYAIPRELVLVIVNEPTLLEIFSKVLNDRPNRSALVIAKVLVNSFLEVMNKNKINLDNCPITPEQFGEAIDLLETRKINLLVLKLVFEELLANPQSSPEKIVAERNWYQIVDEEELTKICQKILEENADAARKYKLGKKQIFNFFKKAIVKSTDQRADMKKAVEILKKLLQ
ncbi:glutamyl-tRNA(Gln) amidotransferase subunit B, mitochondrial [Belonocnema kinseyi]|uniref:glutamyl-tRNA(Gln) amidotransferase subunit B, mitochondrial n=1 Tax=Belonocnema kinseyi TaxID=2817044 RepID=UPI00143D5296|nr:glutamyl-tRNA(Gln) amidotransferase subunit B, mitochondrial [Belonocnema kinseyi]XP_033211924.1 glutamyl-tRNA(Gln) amidotransferase subunit B, mitochondrial [Belonocnema kinseyi]XP_033211925.1 glutamyl-tRNA(Gln) amidotransferase subunit B, mitochondrial [Belonocnema kinseyi]XP_033211926.1 glutamyl-tRNA(Gln) amidotransferase subunit B, mitochondrial [Belonocnema kinseyi]